MKGRNFDFERVVVSLDGRRIVAGSTDNTAKVWEAATQEQVADWQKEESTAANTVTEVRREEHQQSDLTASSSQQDPGRIRQWLVLAPIRVEARTHEAALAALDRQQLQNESQTHPSADERVMVDGIELAWKQVQTKDDMLNFNAFLGGVTQWTLAYAVCYIQSDYDQKGVVMKVNRDDWARIFLNGTEISRHDEENIASPDWELDTAAGLQLKAGVNTIVFKVENEEGDWFASARFTDAAGQSLKGIRVTLTPPTDSPLLMK